MSRMFPSGQKEFSTPGEESFYKFLEDIGGSDLLAWYSPDIESREPDFILFAPCSGILVLEVKDWVVDQILELDPKSALLQLGQKVERRKQPFAQAREYVHSILTLLRKNARKINNNKPEIPFPIESGVVLPHIRRDDFISKKFDRVMDISKIFFWDDIEPGSPLLKDKSGRKFRGWLLEHFPPMFAFSADAQDMAWLRKCIFPVVSINLPKRWNGAEESQSMLALDQDQENLARTFGPGKILIQGPAGCGKTLVLTHQAWHLPRVDKKIRRILFTCFNFSLVGYIKRLMSRKNVPLGRDSVEVIPFYSLCEQILGEKLAHSGEGNDYYSLIVQEALERLDQNHPLKGRWDAVLIDEGQDFSEAMALLATRLLRQNGTLAVAEDETQNLYENASSPWLKILGSELKITCLNRQYRNAGEIARLGDFVLGAAKENSNKGGEVQILEAANLSELAVGIAKECRAMADDGLPMSEIAILYTKSHIDGILIPALLQEYLEEAGLLARWSSRNVESKVHYDITTDSVTISTIHSAKGLDYACVFLVGLEELDCGISAHRQLAYVGITRARRKLFIGLFKNTGFGQFFRKFLGKH